MRQSFYRSFEEFEREELRPSRSRVGFSLDEIEESVFDSELEFDEYDDDDARR